MAPHLGLNLQVWTFVVLATESLQLSVKSFYTETAAPESWSLFLGIL